MAARKQGKKTATAVPFTPEPIALPSVVKAQPLRGETVSVRVTNTGKGGIFFNGGSVLLPPLASKDLLVDDRGLKRLKHLHDRRKISIVINTPQGPFTPERDEPPKVVPGDLGTVGKELARIRKGSAHLEQIAPDTIGGVLEENEDDGDPEGEDQDFES